MERSCTLRQFFKNSVGASMRLLDQVKTVRFNANDHRPARLIVMEASKAMASIPNRPVEVRETEERMRSVVNHVVDGIISIDGVGKITTFNPAAERIFGYEADAVIGQNVNILMPEPYHGEHDGYIAN